MKRDSLDEALRRKLHDAEAGLPVPPWAEMQRRMQLHANAHPAERVPLLCRRRSRPARHRVGRLAGSAHALVGREIYGRNGGAAASRFR